MRKVFVPNKSPHDYSEAWDYGDLVFCTQGELNRVDVLTMQADIERAMVDATEEDYILVSSLTSLCSIACAVFAHRFGRLNLLMYEKDSGYTSRQIFLDKDKREQSHETTEVY